MSSPGSPCFASSSSAAKRRRYRMASRTSSITAGSPENACSAIADQCASSGPRLTSQPTIQQKIVGGIRAATSPMNSQPPAPSTSSSRSATRRAVRARSTSIRRGVNQGITTRRRSWWSPPSDPSRVRGPSTGGSVRTGAAHHLEDAGAERGVEQQRVAALVREHPEAGRRAHDPRFPAHRAQPAVGIGRERIGGVVEERQLTRQYRHAAAAYRST